MINELTSDANSDNSVKNPERRNFLINLPKAAVVGAAAVAAGAEIIRTAKPDFSIDHANIWHVGEFHSQGVSVDQIKEQLPPNVDLDFYVRELVFSGLNGNNLYTLSPQSVLTATSLDWNQRVTSNEKLDFMKERGAEVMYGDVAVPDTLKSTLDSNNFLHAFGAELALLKVGKDSLVFAIDSIWPDPPKEEVTPPRSTLLRRSILKVLAGVAGGYFLSYTIPYLLSNPNTVNTEFGRSIHRLIGLVSNLDLPRAVLLFRNAIIAHKILNLSEQFHQENGRKANMYIEYGAAHGGIDDLLRLGKGVCEALINAYPDQFIQELVTVNVIPPNIASMRLIGFDPQFRADQDLTNPNSTNITDRLVVDQPLLDLINARLPSITVGP